MKQCTRRVGPDGNFLTEDAEGTETPPHDVNTKGTKGRKDHKDDDEKMGV